LHHDIASTPLLIVGSLLLLAGVQLLVFGLLAEMINNLERRNNAGSKIAQVMHIERRSSVLLAPGVQVERRRSSPAPEPAQFQRRVGGEARAAVSFTSGFDHDAS